MKLIELVRECRERGCRFISVDANNRVYYSCYKPWLNFNKAQWLGFGTTGFTYLGSYNLKCDWTKSLIDVTKLKGVW